MSCGVAVVVCVLCMVVCGCVVVYSRVWLYVVVCLCVWLCVSRVHSNDVIFSDGLKLQSLKNISVCLELLSSQSKNFTSR